VTVDDLQFMDRFEIRVVSSIEADPNQDLLSAESPMGSALIGHAKGDDVVFDAPEGKKRYKVIEITR
jgi:transcription elongation factor GreA